MTNEIKIWWAVAIIVFALSSCQAIKLREEHKTMRKAMEEGYTYDRGGFEIKFKDKE